MITDLKLPPDGTLPEQWAIKLYSERHISQGRAEEMCGLSRQAFIEELSKYGVSPFQETVEDLQKSISEPQFQANLIPDKHGKLNLAPWATTSLSKEPVNEQDKHIVIQSDYWPIIYKSTNEVWIIKSEKGRK